MYSFNPEALPRVNKFKRYKIGLIFFVVYVLLSQGSTVISNHSKPEHNPFFQSYLQISLLSLLLLSSFLMNRCMSRKSRETLDMFRYFIPEWKHEEKGNGYMVLSSSYIVFETTEERFYKEVHRIAFILMLLLFFSLSLMQIAQNESGEVLLPLSFYICSVIVIMLLRVFMLHLQKFNLLSIIAFCFVLLGLGFLFAYELMINIHISHIDIAKIYTYSSIGGICFGFFSIFLKYYYNQYCNYFQFSLIFGYIGLYCLITMPCFLCILAMFGCEIDMTVTINEVWKYICYFIICLFKTMTLSHCILSLSPLVFNFGCFVNVGVNMTLYIILGTIEFHYLYVVGIVLLLIAMILCVVDKYKKNAEKEKQRLSKAEVIPRDNAKFREGKTNIDFDKIQTVTLEPLIKPDDKHTLNDS